MNLDSTAGKWFKRTVLAALVIANLAALYTVYKIEDVQEVFRESLDTVPMVEEVLDAPPPDPKDPITMLMLGSDSRENLPDEWLDDFGYFAGQRADVIMLVQLERETGQVQILSIPRDLRVQIEGYGRQKVNAAYAFGGAPLVVSTVRAATGLPIHYYVEIDFVGFAGLVDEVGGVEVEFEHPARDLKSGLAVDAGLQTLDGRMAIAYARSRSYQEQQDGQWVQVDANDIGRTGRQQELLLAILKKVKTPSAIADPNKIIRALGDFMDVDPRFLDLDFFDLALDFRSLDSRNIDAATLPTESQLIESIWYEIPIEPDATNMLAGFASSATFAGSDADPPTSPTVTTVPPVEAADVTIEVRNGNGELGAASSMASRLEELGFVVVAVGDASNFDHQTTQIIAGDRDDIAGFVYGELGFGEVVAGSVPDGADVLVIVGADA